MLQIYSIVHDNTLRKINSHAYITKTYNERKPLPLGTFVLKLNVSHVHFSDKLTPLRIGPYEVLDRLSDVTCEFLSQDGSTFHTHRNNLIPFIQKNHFYIRTFVTSCVFRTLSNMTIQNPLSTLIMIHPHSTHMTHFQTIHLLKKIFLHHHLIHYQIQRFETTLPLLIQDFNQLQKPINLVLRIEHNIILKMT